MLPSEELEPRLGNLPPVAGHEKLSDRPSYLLTNRNDAARVSKWTGCSMADLPVGRFMPSTAITVDRSGTSVYIFGQLELSGPEATADRANSVERWINSTWTRKF